MTGSRKTRSSNADSKEARIRAAGVVQAVISSGAPAEEWTVRTLFGLRVVNYAAARLQQQKPEAPKVPDSLKGSQWEA